MTKPVLILATNGYEQSELTGPRDALNKAGHKTVIASLESGEIRGWQHTDWGDSVRVDLTVDAVRPEEFAGLVLPGGQMNPDVLRMNAQVIEIVREMAALERPIAAICHGPWLLAEADLIRGRTVTSWPSIRTDLRNAGATVVDQEVAVDGNLITSRKPDDIPAFSQALIDALEHASASA